MLLEARQGAIRATGAGNHSSAPGSPYLNPINLDPSPGMFSGRFGSIVPPRTSRDDP